MFNFPSHIIYQGAGSPKLTRNILGEDLPMETRNGHCSLCGCELKEGIQKRHILSNNFTDHDVFNRPSESYLCPACAFTLKIKNGLLRKYTFMATPERLTLYVRNKAEELAKDNPFLEVKSLDNEDNETLRHAYANLFWNLPKDKPFVFSIHDRSNPQHHALRAKVNLSVQGGWYLQYEQETVWIPPYEEIKPLWNAISECRAYSIFSGFIKGMGTYSAPHSTKKVFQDRWNIWCENRDILSAHARTPYINVLVDLFVPKKVLEQEQGGL